MCHGGPEEATCQIGDANANLSESTERGPEEARIDAISEAAYERAPEEVKIADASASEATDGSLPEKARADANASVMGVDVALYASVCGANAPFRVGGVNPPKESDALRLSLRGVTLMVFLSGANASVERTPSVERTALRALPVLKRVVRVSTVRSLMVKHHCSLVGKTPALASNAPRGASSNPVAADSEDTRNERDEPLPIESRRE